MVTEQDLMRRSRCAAASVRRERERASRNFCVDSKNTIAEMDGGLGCLDRVEVEREELERLRVERAQQLSGMHASRELFWKQLGLRL